MAQQGGIRVNNQLRDLHDAIRGRHLRTTQGKEWATSIIAPTEMDRFLQDKLAHQRALAAVDHHTFDYLIQQCVGSAQAQVQAQIDFLLAQHGRCQLWSATHPQLKLPHVHREPTASDKKAGKFIGLIQPQSYTLQEVLNQPGVDAEQRIASVLATFKDKRVIGAHICKRICLNVNHTLLADDNTNTAHDYCPSYWVVKGKLVNFCGCSTTKRCIRPGTAFKPDAFQTALNTIVQ
jgi:hypothetical protein